ncbi:MAG TPA: lytic murein transglycosylase B [Dokdonella sp.]|uniref:lytic murein transglycosylase B n=1 Tax=Dokdonella sp. TaxID=2291710 RepID=UPI002D7E1957|nr:lytic murein transglycosylase B [Dokdonella sp.]HET9033012.1 lytic murein transglycosylase B [Dokdonella sp.]
MAFAFTPVSSVDAANARPVKSKSPVSSTLDPEYVAFARKLQSEDGLVESDVLATLAKAKVQQSILDAMSRPAEAKPWKDYRPIFLTDKRRDDGIAFYRANRELIDRAAAEFAVDAEVIVAIIGVETSYGRNFGSYKVLDALVTLGFHYPPRATFFRGELRQLFLLGDTHMAYPIDELVGSYAGAMGWGQFIPTSVANFARDYDGDGRIDLWNSLPDIVGSVANYFAVHGWEEGQPVAARASIRADARELKPDGLDPVYPIEQLKKWGYLPSDPIEPTELATLLRLEGAQGEESWLTFHNFYVISRYNRSPLYSMAVWQLSREIAAGVAGDKR